MSNAVVPMKKIQRKWIFFQNPLHFFDKCAILFRVKNEVGSGTTVFPLIRLKGMIKL